ncbi:MULTISPECIES: DUF6161 domain-containing protein [Cobetia]|uniref:DUF6161 domain-containing protein n=1 Tax=Cobetia TaxID=204286 RepID=UPI001115713B|nr:MULTISPECIES: DUF6161 domain-containing protein [Cobetia]
MDDVTINVKMKSCAGDELEFTSLKLFYEFMRCEDKFWREFKDEIPTKWRNNNKYVDFGLKFKSAADAIQGWNDVESVTEVQLNQRINQLKADVLKNSGVDWLWSGLPFSRSYMDCLKEYGTTRANSFVGFIIGRGFSGAQNAEEFQGQLYGYEYLNQDSDIMSRAQDEEASLSALRDKFVIEQNALFLHVQNSKNNFEEWNSETRKRAERLNDLQIKLGKRSERLKKKKFDTQIQEWKEEIDLLEKTYKEKLKLQGPADYWRKASRKYGLESLFGIVAFMCINIFALVYFMEFFFGWLHGEPTPLSVGSLQGAIILGSIAAIYAFMMRILTKLIFSSLHLMRDTKEREHLTYLYLSLSNEAAVDEKSREIVLQALFSRSDSGLLGQDSGITMPGISGVVEQLNKR